MIRKPFSRSALLLSSALVLAACGSDAEAPAEGAADGSGAAGDVQGGSISDDMLPLESVTSKAPSRGGDEEGDGEEGGEEDDAETDDAGASEGN